MDKVTPRRRRSPFDWLWYFFASVKVAIVIIILIALSAIIGTVLPQENFIPSATPEIYYPQTYGTFGKFYYKLGFSHMYTSWWFVGLLLALGVSLVICSLERVIPLYKSLQQQAVKPALSVIQRRDIYIPIMDGTPEAADRLAETLSRRRYKIRREGSAFLAEKMRISRFGAYILHIGLIIIILGALSRLIPGWYVSENIWVEEGQTKPVPGADFSIRNDEFKVDFYDDGRPSHFETQASIIQNGTVVRNDSIVVNHPLKHEGTLIFQANFLPPMLRELDVELTDKQSGSKAGRFKIDFSNMQPEYKVGDYKVRALDYFPDFVFLNDQPSTRSTDPNNPVMMIQVEGPGISTPVKQWFFPLGQMALEQESKFDLVPVGGKMIETTGLRIQKDNGIPIVYAGCLVVLAGLVLVFYFQHRRVWGRIDDGVLHIGAHTNKNWYGMRKELEKIIHTMGWEADVTIRKGGKS